MGFLAGFVFPPWLTAFATREDGGFYLNWSFMMFETFFSTHGCLGHRYTLNSESCMIEYHTSAGIAIDLHAPVLLIMANVCLVFLCQLGRCGLGRCGAITPASGHYVHDAVHIWVISTAFYLPMAPLSILMSEDSTPTGLLNFTAAVNVARKTWVSIGMPSCFAVLLPLACGCWSFNSAAATVSISSINCIATL